MASSEVEPRDWQCDKSLAECMDHLFTAGIACDVTFLVGENKDRISSHKIILLSRSPVFYAMLDGPLAEKGEITIPDISKETFTKFLRYLYTDDIQLTVDTAIQMMSVARKYCVDRLVNKCVTFLNENMTADNVHGVYEHAHIYTEENIKADCIRVMSKDDGRGLRSPGFVELCRSCVKGITESDDLAVAESEVFEAVIRWSDSECARQGLEVTEVNRREVLGDIFYNVRFPVMDKTYISDTVSLVDILTSDEFRNIVRCQRDEKNYPCKMFNVKKRKLTALPEQPSGHFTFNQSPSRPAKSFRRNYYN